jgi:hypothetical protein
VHSILVSICFLREPAFSLDRAVALEQATALHNSHSAGRDFFIAPGCRGGI